MAKIRIYRMGVSILNADGKWEMKYGKPYTDPMACVEAAKSHIASHPRTRYMMWDEEVEEDEL